MMVSQEQKNKVFMKHYNNMLKFLKKASFGWAVYGNSEDVLHSFFIHWSRQKIALIENKELDALLWTALINYAKTVRTQYHRRTILETEKYIEDLLLKDVIRDCDARLLLEDFYNELNEKYKELFLLLLESEWCVKEACEGTGVRYKTFAERVRRGLIPKLKKLAEEY
jgi:DNA-directed RNA polymerase specialized sigma24 family protein